MRGIEPGRVCIKTKGRDAGSKCVVVEVIDHNFVKIVSAGRKGVRRANIAHLEPMDRIVDVSNESEVKSAIS